MMLIRISLLTHILLLTFLFGNSQTNQSPHLQISVEEEALEPSTCIFQKDKLRHIKLKISNVDMEKVESTYTTFRIQDLDQVYKGGYRVSGHNKISGSRLDKWLTDKEAYAAEYFLVIEVSLLFKTGLSIQVSERFCLKKE